MAGRTTSDKDSLQPLFDELKEMWRQIRTLQTPTGTSVGSLVQQVQTALIGITDTVATAVTAFLASGFSTGGNVSVTGDVTATGAVTASGAVTGDTGTFSAGLNSPDVYGRLVTYGAYRATWTNVDGTIGYAPSSARFKQDVLTAELDARAILPLLRVVTFRYIAAVEMSGDDAATEWGVIAEEIHELGLTWLVDYDDAGAPMGVKHERFVFLLILDAQEKQSQLDRVAERLTALEAKLDGGTERVPGIGSMNFR